MALKLFGFSFMQSQKIIAKRSENDRLTFVSSLEGVGPKGIHIALPICNLKPMPLIRGQEIFVLISLQSFSIEFKTRVKGFKRDNIPLVLLEHPKDYKRVQRRNSVRLKVLLDIEVALLPEEQGQEPVFEKGQALDLSAGGMEIITRLGAGKDQIILAKFDLDIDKDKTHSFCIKSRVKRVMTVPPRSKKLGVEFFDLSTTESDKIFHYIFKKSTTALI